MNWINALGVILMAFISIQHKANKWDQHFFILHTFGMNEQMIVPLLKIMSYLQNNTLILCRYVTFQFHHAPITFYSCFEA
jgi:hypothetical protein